MDSVDAQAGTVEASAALMGKAMGWGSTSFAELCREFANTPVPQIPRHIAIKVIHSRLVTAQPRVLFTFEQPQQQSKDFFSPDG
ncbi:hypothetical protein IV102_08900 [bacterium]|nr:hypothetical protein [bacterium]